MWMFCIRFIGSNFLREFKVPYSQKLVVNIRYSRIVEEYNINYKRLQERGKAYARWCDNIERPQWGARNLPILALVRATYYQLNELFMRKSTEAHQHKRAGVTYSEFATQWIETNMQRAGNIVVYRFDRRNEVFEVCEMPSGRISSSWSRAPAFASLVAEADRTSQAASAPSGGGGGSWSSSCFVSEPVNQVSSLRVFDPVLSLVQFPF
ncbi:hypothetical protein AHAS_Ahas16G0006300 [Arachis hypogaea]